MAFPLQMRRRLPVDSRRLGYSDMDGTKETAGLESAFLSQVFEKFPIEKAVQGPMWVHPLRSPRMCFLL